jgi:hypothetical protein
MLKTVNSTEVPQKDQENRAGFQHSLQINPPPTESGQVKSRGPAGPWEWANGTLPGHEAPSLPHGFHPCRRITLFKGSLFE